MEILFIKNWAMNTKIARIRRDRLQKISTTLSKKHAIIVLENVQTKNMTKSSKGSMEKPGKMVKQKSGLNREILNQGWGMLKEMLKYKQLWRGGEVIFVDPKYTSQTCPRPSCSHQSPDNRKTQAHFECVKCGYTNNADHVGALNVLARGHRVLACGEIDISRLGEAGTRVVRENNEPNLVFN